MPGKRVRFTSPGGTVEGFFARQMDSGRGRVYCCSLATAILAFCFVSPKFGFLYIGGYNGLAVAMAIALALSIYAASRASKLWLTSMAATIITVLFMFSKLH